MSILIMGADPPENCDDCDYEWNCKHGQHIDGYKMQSGRPKSCPIVEIRVPHGRLIDADELLKKGVEMDWSVQKWVNEVDIGLMETIVSEEKQC